MGNIYEDKTGEQNPLAMNSGGLSPRARTLFWGIFLASLLPRRYFFRPGLSARRPLQAPPAPAPRYRALSALPRHRVPSRAPLLLDGEAPVQEREYGAYRH